MKKEDIVAAAPSPSTPEIRVKRNGGGALAQLRRSA